MAHVACGDTEKALEALQTSTWSTEAGLSLARRRRIVEVAWRSGRFLLALDACHGAPDLRLLTDFAEAVAGRLRSDHHRRGPLDLSTTRDPETWSALGVAAWVLLKEGSAVPESFGAWLRACIAGLADLDPDGGRCLAILQQAIEEPAHGLAAPLLQALQKGTLGVAGLPGAFACPLRDLWARVEEDPAPAEGLAVALLLGRLGASAWALEHAGRQLMGHPMQDGLMGRVHLVLGRPERACELLEEVGDQFGDEDRWTLALAHCAGGDVAMGLERLRQLHLAHASVDSALWLCRGFDLAGAPSAALPVALEAWKEHGPQDALIGTLITGLAASGRIQQALDLADDAVRVLPANWLAHQLVASLPYALDASRPAEVRQRAAEALAQMGARPTWHARLEAIFHDHPTLPNLERVVQAWLSLDAERARSWVQEGLEVLGPSPELTGLTARVDAMIEQPAEALSSDEADFLAGLWDGGALWDWCQAERFGRSLGLPPGVQATTRAGMEIAGGPIAIDPEGLQQAIRAEPECPDLWRLLAWRATCGGRGEVVMATATELSGLGVVKAECLGWSIAGAALSSRLQEGLELGTHLVESGGRQAGPMLILGVLHLVVGQVEAARALMGSPPLSGLVMAPPLAAQVLAHLDRSWITALEFHADGLDVLDNESMAWLRSLLARSRTGSREALATCSEAAASHSTSVRLALLWALSAHRAQDRGELTAALARLQALDSDWEAPMLSLLLEEGDRRLPRWSQEAR